MNKYSIQSSQFQGWFSLEEGNFEIYQKSKLKKFMERVKFMMQDTLRYLVQDSLSNFVQMNLDGAASVMRLEEGFQWDGDLLTSRFRPKRSPLFLVDLQLDAQGAHYSTPLSNFDSALVNLFNKAIQNTQNVLQLEKVW